MNLTDAPEIYNDYEFDECAVISVDRRWYMVAVVGTGLSLISLFSNLLIARVLLQSRHSHFFFLALLAVNDSFLSFMYGPVVAMDIIKDRLQILWLTRLYWGYVGPLLALSQVSMTFSCFLIILATIERYLITEKSESLKAFRQNRCFLAVSMFILAMVLRGTLVFEIEIQKNGNCTGLTEYVPGLTNLVATWLYGTVFRFYLRNITTVFIPFFLLAYLNYRIVRTLRAQQRSAELFRFGTSEHKRKIRSATRLLVLIVCSYLCANILNVMITMWEYVHFDSTQYDGAYEIYETCTDVISVLYILVCATRLLVYMSSNGEIRDAVRDYLCGWRGHKKEQKYAIVAEETPNLSACAALERNRVGTELDAVAIAVARRLVSAQPTPVSSPLRTPERIPSHLALSAIVYSNSFDECEPHMV